jgi:hypothetical protein
MLLSLLSRLFAVGRDGIGDACWQMAAAPASSNRLWIVKPVGGARGCGVRLVGADPAELTAAERAGCLAQVYVARPLLLGGLKVRLTAAVDLATRRENPTAPQQPARSGRVGESAASSAPPHGPPYSLLEMICHSPTPAGRSSCLRPRHTAPLLEYSPLETRCHSLTPAGRLLVGGAASSPTSGSMLR